MKIFVLNSGGLDSATCLGLMIHLWTKENVESVSFSYGQKHDKELLCARNVALHYGVEHHVIDLTESQIFKGTDCTLLKNSTDDIKDGSYSEQAKGGIVDTYVPFRNGLFLSAVTSLAMSLYPNEDIRIIVGVHSDDIAGSAYADCSKNFIDTMSAAITLGTYGKVSIESPYVNFDKAQIVSDGLTLNVPYDLTWSCYRGGNRACGRCSTCIDRQKAFKKNNTKDPIRYE